MSPEETPAERAARRRRDFLTRVGPHRQAGEVVMRHDVGDVLARTYGMPMVRVLCGRGDPDGVVSTVTTRSDEQTKCPNCLAAIAAAPPQDGAQ